VTKLQNGGKGKVALVTGANTGIGKQTAQILAALGFHVIIAGRNMAAMETAKLDIDLTLKDDSGGRVSLLKTPLDLGSVASIKAYSRDFLEQKLPLHVLVNNAGVTNITKRTPEGLEYIMGVNWFGGFLLTNLLLNVLKASQPSRVIIVSSGLHGKGHITIDNIDKIINPPDDYLQQTSSPTMWNPICQAYNDSKLANVMHARVLAKKLQGTGVSVFSLHPGVVKTEIGRQVSGCWKILLSFFSMFFRSPSQGAVTSVFCAIEKGLEEHSGAYFDDCRVAKFLTPAATDDKICDALWAKGEELTRKFAS